MTTLTPDECFALYPPGAEAVIALIRHRLENPAEGGHRHHLLIINRSRPTLMKLWSRLLDCEVTPDTIPLVSVTGPEHYWIHAELARCYQAQGSKGRFSAHGMAANLLSRFAEMDEAGWEEHRKLHSAAVMALYADPGWKTKHLATMQALYATPEWQARVRAGVKKSWANNPERLAAVRARQAEQALKPEWRAKMQSIAQAKAQDPGFVANCKTAKQASFPDVIVTYPDGREERFAGQGEAARAIGLAQNTISRHLHGESKAPRGAFRGYSFRYAA